MFIIAPCYKRVDNSDVFKMFCHIVKSYEKGDLIYNIFNCQNTSFLWFIIFWEWPVLLITNIYRKLIWLFRIPLCSIKGN